MGLDIPDLDDREFEEILEDALKRIPVHSEEWTDHNAHDPGITLLETLSWLTETYIYQLNRVTDAHRRKHLDLLGVQPKPPIPAEVDLHLASEAPGEKDGLAAFRGKEIPEGEKVTVDDGSGFTGTFETTKPVTLTLASIERVVTDTPEGLTDNTNANETYGMGFLAFGERATRGSAMYLGLDRDPFAAAEEDIIDVTVDFDDADLPEIHAHEDDDPAFRPSVEVAWQFCTDYDNWESDEAWRDFELRRDQTNELYQGGTVAIERPDGEWMDETKAKLMLADEYGDRLRSEGRDEEPAETDPDEGLVWIRCTVEEPGYEIPPPLNSVRLDVVPARHRAETDEPEELERPGGGTETTASPEQTFEFEHTPVLEAEITIGGEPWEAVTDFDASGPDDRHYVIDSAREAIGFGDGIDGTVPAAGQTVVAESYVYGGGERGNVPRSSSCEFESATFEDLPVSLADGASGGADAESVDAAAIRLRDDLETPYRGVSLDDYRRLAEQTPGLRFGRVATLVADGDRAAERADRNEVRAVVVPYSTLAKPQPSEGFLNAVRRHLEKHRLLTDRVRVEAPTYISIRVETEVRIAPGYSEGARIEAIEAALDEFLDPLGRSGGEGWPFGRPVYKSELYEVIENVDGIDVAFEVAIISGKEGDRDADGNVLMGDSALPYPDGHEVKVQRDSNGRGS
jgi:predicted phage baseplate assembly protein